MAKTREGKDKYLAKIKALRDTAASLEKDGDIDAAENFLKKANDLLLEYNLSWSDLHEFESKEGDPFEAWGYSERLTIKENLAGNRWLHDLAKMLGRHNLCGVMGQDIKKTKLFVFYGDMSNVEQCVWLFNFLRVTLLRLARDYMNGLSEAEFESACRHTHMKSYIAGAIHGIDDKLTEQKRKSEHAKQIFEMVVYNDKKQIEYIKHAFPGATFSDSRKVSHKMDAYAEGYIDGKAINTGERRLSNHEDKAKGKLLS